MRCSPACCLPLSLSPSFSKTHHLAKPLTQNPRVIQQSRRRQTLLDPKTSSSLGFGSRILLPSTAVGAYSSRGFIDRHPEDQIILPPPVEEKPIKFLIWVAVWASLSLVWFASSGDAKAGVDSSIKASSFGFRIANALRSSGWPDEAVVFALATIPVLELRGDIPVGYWLQLKPVELTVLSVIGNMVPVPFIILYMKKFASFLAGRNQTASQFLDMLFKSAKEKAGPVEEFQWLGLMLFAAVPFPGTGAWTGAIIASILDMSFWPAVSANFFGVVLVGLLVNLLVNLGLKYAIVTGIVLFFVSSFMWSILRNVRKSFSSPSIDHLNGSGHRDKIQF